MSDRKRKRSNVELLSIPNAVLNLIWVFIPREFLQNRCSCQCFANLDPSTELESAIWKKIQNTAKASFYSDRVLSILETPLEPCETLGELFHVKESKKFISMITKIANRIAASFLMEFHIVGLECIDKFPTASRNKLFQLFLFAMTYIWGTHVHITIPKLSHEEHELLASAILLQNEKRSIKYLKESHKRLLCDDNGESRYLTFDKQKLSIENVASWSQSSRIWLDSYKNGKM
jgi:hypothetical protein